MAAPAPDMAVASVSPPPTFSKKTYSIPGGPKYAYVYSKAKANKPTFLLVHGFPSTSADWGYQIADLTAAGYGVLAPDMLGYGDTDKPTELSAYAFSKIAGQLTKILDHEGLKQVIGVGHDWGAALLGKMWNYSPQYFTKLVFMSVPYQPPQPFDLDYINAQAKAFFGYETLGYMYFFNESDAASILAAHTASTLSLIFPDDTDIQKTELSPRGKAKEWISIGRTTGLPFWETKASRDARIKTFTKGGWVAPTNWYKAVIRNIDAEREAQIPAANYIINKPVIFVGGDRDLVTRSELMASVAAQGQEEGWLPNVEFKTVTGGSHWLILEQPKQVFAILDGFAKAA